ncbi:MAG: 6-phosphofructokinase, partial [Planctomycetaceae bacterium]|nr:6-phosphofructokinase [Planctomycetaceae bacterium]
PRLVHPALYDQDRFQPSKLGVEYLMPIFNDAVGWDDAEFHHSHLFSPGNLTTRYQSVNVSVQKRIRYLG